MKDKITIIVRNTAIEILENNEKKYDINYLKLYSKDGLFDSMDLVNFISSLEEKLFAELKINIQFTHSSIFSSTKSPFKDVESITDFILTLI